ncbi:DUF6950 family protein [Oceaniradius stylonematis]|uniref:DUF6950 family protein n=1 Tax=Oceaniradius stylonematis TaxID=2184161 RepID=UPI00273FBBF4|nr:hypothetical protein [Oceaniradius stylonematis]
MTIENRLRAYIDAAPKDAVQWGHSDCSRFAQGWFEQETGRAVDAPSYASEAEAQDLIAQAGSLAALWTQYLGEPDHVRDPDVGFADIGIIAITGGRQCGGIFMKNRTMALRGLAGVSVLRPRGIVAAWSVHR